MSELQDIVLGNRYNLIEKIGEGGMALVYKAKCQLLNRYVVTCFIITFKRWCSRS